MQIVPPRVADILRALDGLPPQDASALLRQVLVGLDSVERESMLRMLPAQNPVLAPQVLALLSDPTALPTLMQRAPMPWEPQIENAEFSEIAEESTTTVAELGPEESGPPIVEGPKVDTVSLAQDELARMLRRSRYLTAAAAAVLLVVTAGVLCLSLGSSEPLPGVEAPAVPAAAVARRRPALPAREVDEGLPELPAAKKHPQTVASASAPTALGASKRKADPDPRTSWSQWPKGASTHSTKTPPAKAGEDDSLTRAWDQR